MTAQEQQLLEKLEREALEGPGWCYLTRQERQIADKIDKSWIERFGAFVRISSAGARSLYYERKNREPLPPPAYDPELEGIEKTAPKHGSEVSKSATGKTDRKR